MLQKKNTVLGKIKSFLLLNLIFFIFCNQSIGENVLQGNFVEINVLDKVSSKNTTIKMKIGEEKKFQNLLIKAMKCQNSKFDDDPEVTAYLQVKDFTQTNNDKVFIFNGWTFSSSPSIRPFDHPVYDIWLTKCIN